VGFEVVSLFINIQVEKVLQIIGNILNTDPSFPQCSPLQAYNLMELLEVYLINTHFKFEVKFYQQNDGMAMGNYLQ
jgi:hypothetical protein